MVAVERYSFGDIWLFEYVASDRFGVQERKGTRLRFVTGQLIDFFKDVKFNLGGSRILRRIFCDKLASSKGSLLVFEKLMDGSSQSEIRSMSCV